MPHCGSRGRRASKATGCQHLAANGASNAVQGGVRDIDASELKTPLLFLALGGMPPGLDAPTLRHTAAQTAPVEPPPGLELAIRPPPGIFARARVSPEEYPMKVHLPAPASLPLTCGLQTSLTVPLTMETPLEPPEAPTGKPQQPPAKQKQTRKARRTTLVIAYFPRAASDGEICQALDAATGRVNSVRRCHVVRDDALYGIFEFAGGGLAELALEACSEGKVVMQDQTRRKWYLHASRSNHITVLSGKRMAQWQARGCVQKADSLQDSSDASLDSGRC